MATLTRTRPKRSKRAQPRTVNTTIQGEGAMASSEQDQNQLGVHIVAPSNDDFTPPGLHLRGVITEDDLGEDRSKKLSSLRGSKTCNLSTRRTPTEPELLSPLAPLTPETHFSRTTPNRGSTIPPIPSRGFPSPKERESSTSPTQMSEGAWIRRRHDKAADRQHQEEGLDKELELEQFAELAGEVMINCLEGTGYDTQSLKQQMSDLARGFTSQYLSRRRTPAPTTPLKLHQDLPRQDLTEPSGTVQQKKSVHYDGTSRVALQQFRNGSIRDGVYTNIPDQGITFDKDGYPIDRHSESNRNSHREGKKLRMSSHPAQSHAGNRGNPGRDRGDSNNDSSYDEESEDEENKSLPPMDEEEEFDKEISILRTPTRSRDYTSPRRMMPGSSRVQRYLESQTRSHSYKWNHTDELNSYQDKGTRRPSKYLKAMHRKIHEQINSKVSVPVEAPVGSRSGPKVSSPPKFGGSVDTEEFECWLSTLLWWLKVNKVCGLELDSEHVEFAAIHLEGIMLTQFEDNIDSVYR